MELLLILLTILGLGLFEIITSVDNAVINAQVLSGMSARARRWFLLWGFLFAVIVVRGLLPLIILWVANPQLGLLGSLSLSLTNGEAARQAIDKSAPALLLGGGTFLTFLFFNWLFLEPKSFGLKGEKFFAKQGAWFFAIVSVLLAAIVWFALKQNQMMAFAAVLGSTAFFIVHGFSNYAREKEESLMGSSISDISKIAYLEVLDAAFSIDGVVGAFAFTFSVPLIFLGTGLGALVLRRLTVSNIERIKRFKYLENGAMYSMLFLGLIMIGDAFGLNIPEYFSPIVTFIIVGYFLFISRREAKSG